MHHKHPIGGDNFFGANPVAWGAFFHSVRCRVSDITVGCFLTLVRSAYFVPSVGITLNEEMSITTYNHSEEDSSNIHNHFPNWRLMFMSYPISHTWNAPHLSQLTSLKYLPTPSCPPTAPFYQSHAKLTVRRPVGDLARSKVSLKWKAPAKHQGSMKDDCIKPPAATPDDEGQLKNPRFSCGIPISICL